MVQEGQVCKQIVLNDSLAEKSQGIHPQRQNLQSVRWCLLPDVYSSASYEKWRQGWDLALFWQVFHWGRRPWKSTKIRIALKCLTKLEVPIVNTIGRNFSPGREEVWAKKHECRTIEWNVVGHRSSDFTFYLGCRKHFRHDQTTSKEDWQIDRN